MWRFMRKPTYVHYVEVEGKGGIDLAYEPRLPDRAPGWRARETELEKLERDRQEAEDWFAKRRDRNKRDNLERKLRNQREKEGRALSLIEPTHDGGERPRPPHADVRRLPMQQDRPAAQDGWGISTRPEYRAELDATSSKKHDTRLYELEARSAPQQLNSNTQSRQRSMQHDQPRRTTQRFELMGNVPGDLSRPPQPTSGYHAGTYQRNYHSMAPLQPPERQRDLASYQPQAIIAGQRTRGQRPIHYPPGFFENPRTPPDISKYNRPPSELNIW